jgi:hypothetical protein
MNHKISRALYGAFVLLGLMLALGNLRAAIRRTLPASATATASSGTQP